MLVWLFTSSSNTDVIHQGSSKVSHYIRLFVTRTDNIKLPDSIFDYKFAKKYCLLITEQHARGKTETTNLHWTYLKYNSIPCVIRDVHQCWLVVYHKLTNQKKTSSRHKVTLTRHDKKVYISQSTGSVYHTEPKRHYGHNYRKNKWHIAAIRTAK